MSCQVVPCTTLFVYSLNKRILAGVLRVLKVMLVISIVVNFFRYYLQRLRYLLCTVGGTTSMRLLRWFKLLPIRILSVIGHWETLFVFCSVVPRVQPLGISRCHFRQLANVSNSQFRESTSRVSHLAYFSYLHLDRLLYRSRDGVHFDQNGEPKFYLFLDWL